MSETEKRKADDVEEGQTATRPKLEEEDVIENKEVDNFDEIEPLRKQLQEVEELLLLSTGEDNENEELINLRDSLKVLIESNEEVEVPVEPDLQGVVKMYNCETGMGLIEFSIDDKTNEKINAVVSWNSIVSKDHQFLQEESMVLFNLETGENNIYTAKNVRTLDGNPFPGILDVHSDSWPGKREYQEDRILVNENFGDFGKLFCVFDGHGGSECVDYVLKYLPINLKKHISRNGAKCHSNKGAVCKTLTEIFRTTDEGFLNSKNSEGSGSTGCCALIRSDRNNKYQLFLANVGDSRAVLCRNGNAVRISTDHKPDNKSERARILSNGGSIKTLQGVVRVWKEIKPKHTCLLSVSRSFGDKPFKDNRQRPVVSAEPEIDIYDLNPTDEFLIIACDGIWDVFEDEDAVEHVRTCQEQGKQNLATELIRKAYNKGSADNLSAIVVYFPWFSPSITEKKLQKENEEVGGILKIVDEKENTKEEEDFDMFA